jgi:hypothetical protein
MIERSFFTNFILISILYLEYQEKIFVDLDLLFSIMVRKK